MISKISENRTVNHRNRRHNAKLNLNPSQPDGLLRHIINFTCYTKWNAHAMCQGCTYRSCHKQVDPHWQVRLVHVNWWPDYLMPPCQMIAPPPAILAFCSSSFLIFSFHVTLLHAYIHAPLSHPCFLGSCVLPFFLVTQQQQDLSLSHIYYSHMSFCLSPLMLSCCPCTNCKSLPWSMWVYMFAVRL